MENAPFSRLGNRKKTPANKACSGRRGVCGFDKQFSTPQPFSALWLFSTPAPRPPLTHTVETVEKPFCQKNLQKISHWRQKMGQKSIKAPLEA
jgi:hypothetical protein